MGAGIASKKRNIWTGANNSLDGAGVVKVRPDGCEVHRKTGVWRGANRKGLNIPFACGVHRCHGNVDRTGLTQR